MGGRSFKADEDWDVLLDALQMRKDSLTVIRGMWLAMLIGVADFVQIVSEVVKSWKWKAGNLTSFVVVVPYLQLLSLL